MSVYYRDSSSKYQQKQGMDDIVYIMNKDIKSFLSKLYGTYALRATIFATFSAISAYSVAVAFKDVISPTIAAIIALTAIKTSITDTVRETFKQVGGSFFGAILGILLVGWLGFNALSLLIAVSLSMLLGFIIRLEVQGGLAIAATVILVSGPLFGDYQSIEQRVAGVIIGSLFAFIASLLMLPWKPEKAILRKVLTYGEETAKILDEIAKHYASNSKLSKKQITKWLERIELTLFELKELNRDASQLHLDSKWTPFITASSAENIKKQAEIAKINASATRTMVFAIRNSYEHKVELTDSAARKLSNLIEASSSAIKQQLFTALTQPANHLDENVAENIRAKRAKLANAMTKMDDTRAIMLSGTIMHEATKIKDLITEVNRD